MNSILVPFLSGIAQAPSADDYLRAQDEALPMAAAQYDLLIEEAREQDDPALRAEALGLIALLERADAETLLLASAREDPEPEVAEHAQALLYRLGVGRNVRRSGHLSGARFADYQAKARRLGAEARISQRK
ncbi:hypothetical protein C3942_13750 [Solimonas fluminis]|uniref:HEAT repeat domain-containing protein n=1 Tax=Solimonas fluminis TaxID=2086571 RepID=A0A2S5TEC5_9GAMM|nr:hypothetical protein [Solimonas fluminis]PPE73330.1 hypothetical protein C3942_13750 [Solimonas fluminis]